MSDPGMLVLPTHRLFRGLPAMTADGAARASLATAFDTEPAGRGAERRQIAVGRDRNRGRARARLASTRPKDDQWTLARITDAGRRRMAEVAADHWADWQGLGVSILHRLMIDTLARHAAAYLCPRPKYVRDIEEVVRGLKPATPPAATPPARKAAAAGSSWPRW